MSGRDDEAPQPIYLTLDEMLSAYAAALGEDTGDPRAAVHDWNLLASALNRPRQAAYYEGADLIRQAATLLWGLVQNHPFRDGNKRTALVATLAFLTLNEKILTATDDEKFHLLIDITRGWSVDKVEVWLRAHLNASP